MSKELDELRERKDDLLLESDINRQILAVELGQFRLKVAECRRSVTRFGTVYKWFVPLAGAGLGFFAARKQAFRAQAHAHHNGQAKFNYLSLLGPLGAMALRQVFHFWKQARSRRATDSAPSAAQP